jgi:hypothetical protein
MRQGWKRRALTWLVLAESVRANRRAYPNLPTAWLPHGAGNSLALWLPELSAAVGWACRLDQRFERHHTLAALYRTLCELCAENPQWGLYVAPAALGYAVSHPRFNIYKGNLAELRFLGFGLDAIPHAVTAWSLTLLLHDAITALARNLPEDSPLTPVARALARRPALFTAAALATLSAIWEFGEFSIQQDELRRAGGDATAINMEWSAEDTALDLLANSIGWLVATWQRRGQ